MTTQFALQPQPAFPAKYAFKLGGMHWDWYHLPLLLAFASFFFTPFLIKELGAPATIRWTGDAAVASMLGLMILRMLVADRIPAILPAIVALSVVGFTVALFEGQSLVATAWGWWLMFKYPLVGLFVYMAPRWPVNFANRLPGICLVILGLQVIVQAWQYLVEGEDNADMIAGTFGWNGTGILALFIILTLGMGFGRWIVRGEWKMLVLILVLGAASSVLGEIKLFPIVLGLFSALVLLIVTLRDGQIYRAVLYLLLLVGVMVAFVILYNSVIAVETGRPIEEYIFDMGKTNHYLNFATVEGGRYEFGRSYAVNYGWKSIQRDATTFLFGMGLGARSESVSFGLAGAGLQRGYFGVFVGTSLLVMMQEMGVVGLASLAIFSAWLIITLLRAISRQPRTDFAVLCYAIILFTIGWPLWLYYNVAWTLAAPMWLYWTMVGYVLRNSSRLFS